MDCTRRNRGVTLTELLVVLAIMVILMGLMVSALGAFTRTSTVDTAADTLRSAFVEARNCALKNGVPTMPIILRTRDGKYTVVHGTQAMRLNVAFTADQAVPVVYKPPAPATVASGFSLYRQSADLPKLQVGAYVMLMAGMPDLNEIPKAQAYHELVYMRATPPDNPALLNDSSQYTYEILRRGIHNTAQGGYYNGTDGFLIVNATDTAEVPTDAEARDYTLSGIDLPDNIIIDQVTPADAPGAQREGPVYATITAEAALFYEDGQFLAHGGKYETPRYYPVFRPIFMPSGNVSVGLGHNQLGGQELIRSTFTGTADQTLRVFDKTTHEARYITIRSSNGQVVISRKPPVSRTFN